MHNLRNPNRNAGRNKVGHPSRRPQYVTTANCIRGTNR